MGGIGGSSSSRYRHHEWLWSQGLLKEKSWALASFQIVWSDLFHGHRRRPFDLSNPGTSLLALVLLGFLNRLGIHIALVLIWSTPSQQLVPRLLGIVGGECQFLG